GVIPAAEEVLETDPLSYRKTGPLQLLAEGQHQYKKRFFSLRNGRLTHCGMQIKNEFLKRCVCTYVGLWVCAPTVREHACVFEYL
ncbi:hypothetical protein SARC_17940, partial [Sphaeroforma arctica JP610]